MFVAAAYRAVWDRLPVRRRGKSGLSAGVLTILLAPSDALVGSVIAVSLLCLIALGAIAARVGGASVTAGAARVTIWGVLAMLLTAAVGRLFGVSAG